MFHTSKVRAYVSVYWCSVGFAGEDAHIFCPWMLVNGQHFLSFLAEKREISHFHCGRPLAFNRDVYNTCSGGVVHMDGGGGCGCPISSKMRRIILASCPLRNSSKDKIF